VKTEAPSMNTPITKVSDKYSIVNGRWHLLCAMTFKGDNDTPVLKGGSVRTTGGVRDSWSKKATCRLIDFPVRGVEDKSGQQKKAKNTSNAF